MSNLLNLILSEHRISRDIHMVKAIDKDTKFFESLWEIPEGVTYNSYILYTEEGAVLFDSAKHIMSNEYVEFLGKVVDLRDIKFIVTHHLEPDHSGCVKRVAELSKATIIGHPLAEKMLRSFYSYNGSFKPIKDNYEVEIGGYTLRFIHTPWLHWPETMVTYISEKKALVTCDIFGSFGDFENVYYDELSSEAKIKYRFFMKKYFADIIGFYREWVVKNLEKLMGRVEDLELILPAHGLCWRGGSVNEAINLYMNLAKGVFEEDKITIVAFSMYGFVERAVSELMNGLVNNGFRVVFYLFNDKERSLVSEIVAEAYDSEYLVLALSTYDNDAFPLARYVSHILAKKIPRDKKIIILSAYGWGARGGHEIESIFRQAGYMNIGLFEFIAGLHGETIGKVMEFLRKTR